MLFIDKYSALVYFVISVLCTVVLTASETPKIDFPYTNYTLDPGDNFTILCEGNQPVNWTTPRMYDEEDSNFTSISESQREPRHKHRFRYASELLISNFTFPYIGLYSCFEEINEMENMASLYLNIKNTTNAMAQPTIEGATDIAVGGNINLKCSFQSEIQTSIEWKTPQGINDRIFFSPELRDDVSNTKYVSLLIKNATLNDIGQYCCRVTDYQNNTSEKKVDVRVFESPRIDLNETEYVLEPGSNFTIFCEGNHQLDWTFPHIDTRGNTTLQTKSTEPRLKEIFRYASVLHLRNISYPFVGFYSCYERKGVNQNKASVYLYVRDEHHLSVLYKEEDEFENIFAPKYSDAVIPCRPTAPDVKVSLKTVGFNDVELAAQDENGQVVIYDPHIGFWTNKTIEEQAQYFFCYFQRGNKNYDYQVMLETEPITDYLAQPMIQKNKEANTVVGETIDLKCSVKTEVQTNIKWKTPQLRSERMISSLVERDRDSKIAFASLNIKNITTNDTGEYWCIASDNQNHTSENKINVKVYGLDEHFINLRNVNHLKKVAHELHSNVHFNIEIKAQPEVTIAWLHNGNDAIVSGGRYRIWKNATNANLIINNISYADHGNYTILAKNKFEKKNLRLPLNVTGKPEGELRLGGKFQMVGERCLLSCSVVANPSPHISLDYKPCFDGTCGYEKIKIRRYFNKELSYTINAYEVFKKSGIVRCSANNSLGYVQSTKALYISDIEGGFGMAGINDAVIYNKKRSEARVALGDTITVICGVYIQNVKQMLIWKKGMGNAVAVKSDKKNDVNESHTNFSKRMNLTISNISYTEQDVYTCSYFHIQNEKKILMNEMIIKINVSSPSEPTLVTSNMNATKEMNFGERLELICDFKGLPKPHISWYKNEEVFSPSGSRINFGENNVNITFISTKLIDEGTYRCEGRNRLGTQSREMELIFKNKPSSMFLIYVIVILILLVIAACVIIYIKDSRKRKLEKVLREAGLAYFERGQLENLNPELGIEDQAELLPYDKKWEFPIQNLKLGKQLGAGAFGVVLKGKAKGIVPDEEVTTVAVKMVKRSADHNHIKALASELKIMVHLGKHLNVVNLLGACTKNVTKRELLVIVEYCKFGNLHNYLYRHRDDFINQIDLDLGVIDYNVGNEYMDRKYSVASDKSYIPMKYAAQLSFRSNSTASSTGNTEKRCNNGVSTTGMPDESGIVNMCPRTEQEEGEMLLSNGSSIQPEWRTNYRGDYKGSVRPICTKDLIVWAFQVARGMEYLASRKILHGDLAARNILLADDNIVKICDFGLAKSMYKNDNYKKNSDSPLPIKWMAIESIRDRVFSTQSDVWSFGIVLWEFFSLARTPYPGMEADERLYAKLVDGYRMESPEFATTEIYQMMIDCWSQKPRNRPSFTKLAERLGVLLEESVTQHYIDLNDPYLRINTRRLQEGEDDYLVMVSTPNFENLSSPQNYMNELGNCSGYMSMSTPPMYSPKIEENRIFTFDNQKTSKDIQCAEEAQIELKHLEEDVFIEEKEEKVSEGCEATSEKLDSEMTCTSNTPPTSFFNPSYSVPPLINDKVQELSVETSIDNFLPQDILKQKHNLTIELDQHNAELHYVNGHTRDWTSIVP